MEDTSVIGVIKEIGQIITPIVLAWIALQQVRLSKKQEQIHKDVNGKMAQLLEVTGTAKKAEGKVEGIAQQKEESHSTAEDVVQAIKDDPNIDLTKK